MVLIRAASPPRRLLNTVQASTMAFASFLQSVEEDDVWSLAIPSTMAFSVTAKSLRKSAVLGRSCARKKTLSLRAWQVGLAMNPQTDTLPPLNLATLYYTVPDVNA